MARWQQGTFYPAGKSAQVRRNEKNEEMASEEINVGKCLSSKGSEIQRFVPSCLRFADFPTYAWKTLNVSLNILCTKGKFNLLLETKCYSVSRILALISRQVSSVNSGATEPSARVAFSATPLE